MLSLPSNKSCNKEPFFYRHQLRPSVIVRLQYMQMVHSIVTYMHGDKCKQPVTVANLLECFPVVFLCPCVVMKSAISISTIPNEHRHSYVRTCKCLRTMYMSELREVNIPDQLFSFKKVLQINMKLRKKVETDS